MKKLIALLCVTLFSAAVAARTINIVAPFAPGGVADHASRILAKQLNTDFANSDITFVVQNRPGAGGFSGSHSVARLPNDSIEILVASPAVFIAPAAINPQITEVLPQNNLTAIGYFGESISVLVVSNDTPVTTLDEFAAYCKNNNINFGSSGVGSATHLASEAVYSHFGCKSTHIPFKGQGPAMLAVIGNQITAMLTTFDVAETQIEAGKVKIIAANSTLPKATKFPASLQGANIPLAIFVNSNAPANDIKTIQQAVAKVLKNPDVVAEIQKFKMVNISKTLPKSWLDNEVVFYTNMVKRLGLNDAK